jgi:hypothetical protein
LQIDQKNFIRRNKKVLEMIAVFEFADPPSSTCEPMIRLYVQVRSLGGRVKPDHGEMMTGLDPVIIFAAPKEDARG